MSYSALTHPLMLGRPPMRVLVKGPEVERIWIQPKGELVERQIHVSQLHTIPGFEKVIWCNDIVVAEKAYSNLKLRFSNSIEAIEKMRLPSMVNSDNLLIKYMNDSVGYGVFARESIPVGSTLSLYVGEFFSEHYMIGECQDVETYAIPCSLNDVGLAKMEKNENFINALKFRNFGGIFQDLPNDEVLRKYEMNTTFLRSIQKENISLLDIEDKKLACLETIRVIEKGEMLGFNYGGSSENEYWGNKLFKRLFFDSLGMLLDSKKYRLKKGVMIMPEYKYTNRSVGFLQSGMQALRQELRPKEILASQYLSFEMLSGTNFYKKALAMVDILYYVLQNCDLIMSGDGISKDESVISELIVEYMQKINTRNYQSMFTEIIKRVGELFITEEAGVKDIKKDANAKSAWNLCMIIYWLYKYIMFSNLYTVRVENEGRDPFFTGYLNLNYISKYFNEQYYFPIVKGFMFRHVLPEITVSDDRIYFDAFTTHNHENCVACGTAHQHGRCHIL